LPRRAGRCRFVRYRPRILAISDLRLVQRFAGVCSPLLHQKGKKRAPSGDPSAHSSCAWWHGRGQARKRSAPPRSSSCGSAGVSARGLERISGIAGSATGLRQQGTSRNSATPLNCEGYMDESTPRLRCQGLRAACGSCR